MKISYRITPLLTGFIFALSLCNAQVQFEQLLPANPAGQIFSEIYSISDGGADMADVDGDSDLDLIICGATTFSFTKLYLNDGEGRFTESLDNAFEGARAGTVLFEDVDGDSDYDIFVTGRQQTNTQISILYLNDGNGSFTEVLGTPFIAADKASAAFEDVDADGDPDLLLIGENQQNQRFSRLYINDGEGNFSEAENTPFVGFSDGSLVFSDLDGDGDPDLVISGRTNTEGAVTKLYRNNGLGEFTVASNNPLEPVRFSSIAVSDVDGDLDMDIFITGFNGQVSISKLYLNNGAGLFTEALNSSFIAGGTVSFGDIDNDSDDDLIIIGNSASTFYTNNGSGIFTEVSNESLYKVSRSAALFRDIDGDSDLDLFLMGKPQGLGAVSVFYLNDGSGIFTEVAGCTIRGAMNSAVAYEDVDGDLDLDIVITGEERGGAIISKLYLNNGLGAFEEVTDAPFEGVYEGSVAFSDIDGDNDPDLLITGLNEEDELTLKIYSNDRNGGFSLIFNAPYLGAYEGQVAFADVDGDLDQDFIITGNSSNPPNNGYSTRIYINTGQGFTEDLNSTFAQLLDSALDFEDVDNDGDADVLLTGRVPVSPFAASPYAGLYLNDGNGVFTEVLNSPFVPVYSGSVTFEDVNGDSYPDVLITGGLTQFDESSKLYLNDGSGSFTEVMNTPFIGTASGTAVFGDLDGDSDKDLLLTGASGFPNQRSRVYINNGPSGFSELSDFELDVFGMSSAVIDDFDGDSAPDIFITGWKYNPSDQVARIYRNTTVLDSDEDGITNFLDPCPVFGGFYLADCGVCVDGGTEDETCCDYPVEEINTASLNAIITSFNVGLTWQMVSGQRGCQVQVREQGNLIMVDSIYIYGENINSYIVSGNFLEYGTSYEWRVRCGCSRNPLIANSWTPWQAFTTPEESALISWPNPTEGHSTVEFSLPEATPSNLEVIDVAGRVIENLFSGNAHPDHEYRFEFDGSNLPNGIYLYRLTTLEEVVTEKFMIAR